MRIFAFLTGLTGLCALLAAAPVMAQGYDGLIAPAAPAPSARAPAPSAQPPGYQGLIPGAMPAPAVRPTPTPAQPATTAAQPQKTVPRPRQVPTAVQPTVTAAPSTPVPGAPAVQPIRSSQDLLRLVSAYNFSEDAAAIPDKLAASVRMPASSTELLKQPRPRINGMLPMENTIKNGIDSTLAGLRARNLRPEDRAARVQSAVDSLTTLKRGLTVKNAISDRTYQAMGMPPLYIKEEREAIQKSLAHIDAALAQIQR